MINPNDKTDIFILLLFKTSMIQLEASLNK